MAITTTDLAKHYPEVRAVDGLNLSVPRGSVYGLLGRNGAGKTSTMKSGRNGLNVNHGLGPNVKKVA